MSLFLSWLISSNDPIRAVDTVRLSLESCSAHWFAWVKYAGYAVALGCAMEAPETFVIIKRWCLLRFRDEDREENREERTSWFVPIAAIGLLIIVAGIVVETYAESKVSDNDALLRAHESDKITAAEGEAAAAVKQAGSAATSAKTAHDESDAAKTSSDDALKIAGGARREADTFERDIKSAKESSADANNKAAEAESHLASAYQAAAIAQAEVNRLKSPRSLVNIDKIIAALRDFKGTEYALGTSSDVEQIELTKELAAVLDKAGWVRKQPQQVPLNSLFIPLSAQGPADAIPPCIAIGIAAEAHVKNPSAEIGKTFETAPKELKAVLAFQAALWPNISPADPKNIEPLNLDPKAGEAPITICVGKKP
ncbi:hypothetical protein H7849_22365 [Alloacidobacterium dinghuense]|uniref:Uncharacterized protein n=1 Tax=Alloacidobacterium dinghuense TaxID=2763107 RepID=A0A7G8BGT8_9BACT|nr:hypothetical protein [Alloacidobacterium dinghuense]QNI31758.1 hypothetical protein H7849_22365 [Alloacidobacterium dinghuense]